MKAKQLVDLMHTRAHAGEYRRADALNMAVEQRRKLDEAISLSLRGFVYSLHNAGGSGRYPEKIRQEMQVVAKRVSHAALSTGVTSKAVGDALGLSPRLIGKCKERYDLLQTDGGWEQLFNDHGVERDDKLPEDWQQFALTYWTEPDLGYVRQSERMNDAIRDPNNRKAPKQRLCTLEARIGDMYEAMKDE